MRHAIGKTILVLLLVEITSAQAATVQRPAETLDPAAVGLLEAKRKSGKAVLQGDGMTVYDRDWPDDWGDTVLIRDNEILFIVHKDGKPELRAAAVVEREGFVLRRVDTGYQVIRRPGKKGTVYEMSLSKAGVNQLVERMEEQKNRKGESSFFLEHFARDTGNPLGTSRLTRKKGLETDLLYLDNPEDPATLANLAKASPELAKYENIFQYIYDARKRAMDAASTVKADFEPSLLVEIKWAQMIVPNLYPAIKETSLSPASFHNHQANKSPGRLKRLLKVRIR